MEIFGVSFSAFQKNMMKRFLLLALMACSMTCYAQTEQMKKAMIEGRSKGHGYMVKRKKYSDPNNEMFITHATYEFTYFIPRSEFKKYLYELYTEKVKTKIPFKPLTQQGTGWYFFNNKIEYGVISNEFQYSKKDNVYFRYADKINWSADIVDGRINGTGVGLACVYDSLYVIFAGTYSNGLPVGETTYAWFNTDYKKEILIQQRVKTGKVSDGMVSYVVDKKYGFAGNGGENVAPHYDGVVADFKDGIAVVKEGRIPLMIDKRGYIVGLSDLLELTPQDYLTAKTAHPGLAKVVESRVVQYASKKERTSSELTETAKLFPEVASQIEDIKKNQYLSNFQGLQTYYDQALAAAKAKRTDVSGRKAVESFLNTYQKNQKYDPEGKVATAQRMMNYYTVCDALGVKALESYWTISRKPEFNGNGYKQITQLRDALNICNRDASSEFGSFYTYAKTVLTSNLNKISALVDKSKSEYDAAYSRHCYERERKLRAVDELTWGQVKSLIKYETDWSKGRIRDTDTNFTDNKDVVFKDDIRVYLEWHYVNEPGKKYVSEYSTPGVFDKMSTQEKATFEGYKYKKKEQIENDYPL